MDVNADGQLDIVTSNAEADNVSVLIGNGTGNFATSKEYPVGKYPIAVVLADFAASGGANEDSIWGGFADRGLGYGARCPNKYQFGNFSSYLGMVESFDLPYLDVQSVAIDDSIGNNNGALDPNEPARLTVTLKNPWRRTTKGVASATAVLTSSTPGV